MFSGQNAQKNTQKLCIVYSFMIHRRLYYCCYPCVLTLNTVAVPLRLLQFHLCSSRVPTVLYCSTPKYMVLLKQPPPHAHGVCIRAVVVVTIARVRDTVVC